MGFSLRSKTALIALGILLLGIISLGADFIRQPYLGFGDKPGGMVVSWKTDVPVKAVVYYDLADNFSSTGEFGLSLEVPAEAADEDNIYHVELGGLEPNTAYSYEVILEGGVESPVGTFWTSSADLDHFVFTVYGDTRTYPERHRMVVEAMAAEGPRFVVHTGDLVENGGVEDQWDSRFFWATAPLIKDAPYLTVPGNHENNAPEYYQAFALPRGGGDYGEEWWSMDYGVVHLVGLDTNALTLPNGFGRMIKQINWLKRDLAAARERGAKFIFVFFHHPLFSSSAGYYPGNEGLRAVWHPIFVRYGVTAVFSGHCHSYERLTEDGVTYIVTGGGGAPLGGFRSEPVPGSVRRLAVLHYIRVTIEGNRARLEMIPVARVAGEEILPMEHRPWDSLEIEGPS